MTQIKTQLTEQEVENLIKKGVENGSIPETLFHFRKLIDWNQKKCSDCNAHTFLEWTVNIFIKNELYFSSPYSFNDPFDCRIEPSFISDQNGYYNFSKRNGRLEEECNRFAEVSANDYEMTFSSILHDKMNKEISIACFSQKEENASSNDNILMWSHYADSHKGICLEFEILKDAQFFNCPYVVKYPNNNEYPKLNYIENEKKVIETIIETKSIHWKYEKEVRVLKYESPKSHKFKKEALKTVIFGCETEQKDRKKLIELILSEGYDHIVFKLAVKKKSEFGLDFEIIDVTKLR